MGAAEPLGAGALEPSSWRQKQQKHELRAGEWLASAAGTRHPPTRPLPLRRRTRGLQPPPCSPQKGSPALLGAPSDTQSAAGSRGGGRKRPSCSPWARPAARSEGRVGFGDTVTHPRTPLRSPWGHRGRARSFQPRYGAARARHPAPGTAPAGDPGRDPEREREGKGGEPLAPFHLAGGQPAGSQGSARTKLCF